MRATTTGTGPWLPTVEAGDGVVLVRVRGRTITSEQRAANLAASDMVAAYVAFRVVLTQRGYRQVTEEDRRELQRGG